MPENTYIEFTFSPVPDEAGREMLMAELLVLGFDSFAEEEEHVTAYLPAALHKDDILSGSGFLRQHPSLTVSVKPLEEKNWNEEWEKNFEPVVIAGKCYVRAPFHPARPEFPLEIVIEPKMSFGTAHHDTTRMMAEWLLETDVNGKTVLDMGCGTGILAILANKLGALSVTGIDNDEWACRNAAENFAINLTAAGEVIAGDASCLRNRTFDVILANINRNILLADMAAYSRSLLPGGWIAFSGFLPSDSDAIRKLAEDNGLIFNAMKDSGNWASLLFTKS